jgi:hypothetical protein
MTSRGGRPIVDEILYDGTAGDPTVVWFDPGGVTGWAVFSVHPDALVDHTFRILENITHWACGQFVGGEAEQVDQMLDLARSWPGAAIGTEDFILRKFDRGRELLAPVRMNAAFNYAMRRGMVADPKLGKQKLVKVQYQLSSLAMTTMTDDRLKALGYYERTVGLQHARDAVRHAITFLKRIKEKPQLRAEVFPSL